MGAYMHSSKAGRKGIKQHERFVVDSSRRFKKSFHLLLDPFKGRTFFRIWVEHFIDDSGRYFPWPGESIDRLFSSFTIDFLNATMLLS